MHLRVALGLVALLIAAAPAAADKRKPKERPLPGFRGLTYRVVELQHSCRTEAREVRQVKKGDDAALVKLLTWPRMTGFDVPPDDDARRAAGMRRFQAWMSDLSQLAGKVTDRQAAIARDAARTPVQRVEAVARLVVATEQMAELVAGLEVPPSLRASQFAQEATDAYCDTLADQAEVLAAKVDEARAACRRLIDEHQPGPGWWTDVCADPSAPVVAPATEKVPAPAAGTAPP